jgi:hypothetical protein
MGRDSAEDTTKKPSPSSETSMAVERIVNPGLQEATKDWCD